MSIPALLAAVHNPTAFNLGKYALQPKQQLFYDKIEETQTTFYGGAKGGGKSMGLRLIMLLRRMKYHGSTGAIFRRTLPELEKNHINPMLKQFPELGKYYNSSKKILRLPNTSTLEFCYCDKERDLGKYQGAEFDDLAIEEAGQWPEGWFRTLQGSNRSGKPGIKPRTLLTGNPGGIGHAWLKRLFVDRKFRPNEDASDYAFIQAFVYDNKNLMENDPAYVRRLEAEPNEALRKAFLHGDWNIFAGQFFTEISAHVHLVKPFTIPSHWTRFGAYDFGFNHPASFGWFACDEDGNVYLYRHLKKSRMRVDQFARELLKHKDTEKLYPIVAGHDCWTQRQILKDQPTPPTIADEFKEAGLFLKKATIDRIQGAANLRKYLAWQGLDNGRTQPKFFIFETCSDAYETISRMIHDPDRPEDVLKVDANEGDDSTGDDDYDMIRYGLMSKPLAAEAMIDAPVIGTKAWQDKKNENLFEQAMEHFKKLEGDQRGDWGDDY